jgi:hypothetical protein
LASAILVLASTGWIMVVGQFGEVRLERIRTHNVRFDESVGDLFLKPSDRSLGANPGE